MKIDLLPFSRGNNTLLRAASQLALIIVLYHHFYCLKFIFKLFYTEEN